jgi:hypothetical protein
VVTIIDVEFADSDQGIRGLCGNSHQLVPELMSGLMSYFWFYDEERPHQSLDYRTPGEVYRAGTKGALRRGGP